jgi:glycerol-3-phosphate acyltransferase PlsY
MSDEPFALYAAIAAVSYLLGSIPTGYLVARWRGVDIRKVGSGNIGATNVLRTLGKPAGITVLAVDALKGFVAAMFVPGFFIANPQPKHAIIAAIAVILGHNYTLWLKFKGGKGIATSAGALIALVPAGLFVALIVFVLTFLLSGYVSLASIFAAIALPPAVYFTTPSRSLLITCTVLSVLAIYKHKANIQRLMNGTEHRFKRGEKKKDVTTP